MRHCTAHITHPPIPSRHLNTLQMHVLGTNPLVEITCQNSFNPDSTAPHIHRLFTVFQPRSSWHDGQLLTRYAYLSGVLAGAAEGVAFAPFQVIKV